MISEKENIASAEMAQSERSKEVAISAQRLRKTYPPSKEEPAQEALKSIDLDVPRGSIFGLLGPNGAGKSTFINILAGLTQKSSGKMIAWGFDLDKNPRQVRACVGIVPQELHIDAFFTPTETLDMQAGLYGVPRAARKTKELLAAMHLEDKAHAYARTLSGGMRRRLMVAKAMVHMPPVLVLDEPTAGVDVELRHELWDYMQTLNAQGVTIVLTTHYLEEAQALCDRIAIINFGEVIAEGTTAELLRMIDFKTMRIMLKSPLTRLPEALAAMASDQLKIHLDDGAIQIDYQMHHMNVSEMMRAISEAGIEIVDVSTRESALEDVFLHLTHRRKT